MSPTDPPAARAPSRPGRALAALAAALALGACGQPSGALAPVAAAVAAGGSGGGDPPAAPPPRALVLALSAAGAPPGSPPGGSVSLSAAGGPLAGAGVHRAALSELPVAGDARLRLSATPAEGFAFMRWTGACAAEASPVCLLDVAAQPPGPARAGAEFGPLRRLSVEVVSDGPGLTAAAPPAAPRRLAAGRHRLEYPPGTAVALSPEDAPGARAQWSGDCAGTASTCTLSMDRDRAAGVRFRPVRGLSLSADGPGRLSHRVLSGALGPDGLPLAGGPAGGDPARDEVEAFRGAEVALRAEPDPGALFAGWTGDCARRAEPDCRLRLGDAGAAAGARFGAAAPLAVALASDSGAVGLPGPDAPSVTPSAPWLAPAAARSASFDMLAPAGASATLTAAPPAFPESAAAEVAFVGWFGGQCAGPPTAARCEVAPAGGPPAGARFVPAGGALVEARFARLRSLSVRAASLGGAGAGGARVSGTRLAAVTGTVTLDWGEPPGAPRTVPPDPAGAAEFRALDEPVLRGLRLEAVPDGAGALFLGWVDRDAGEPAACGAEPSCTVPMDRDRALDPWFARLAGMAVLLERLDPGTPESATASLTLSWSPAPPSPAAGFGPSPASFAVAPASPSDTFTTGVPADPAVRVSLEADPGAGGYVNAWGGLPAGASCVREAVSCSFPAASADGALATPTVSFGAYNRLLVSNSHDGGGGPVDGAGSGAVLAFDAARQRTTRLELGPGGAAELGELLDGGQLVLTAAAASGSSRFRGWGGGAPAACAADAASPCRLAADATAGNDLAVSARFEPLVRSTLTVTAQGVGARVAVAGGGSRDVAAGSSAELPVSDADAATLSFAGEAGEGLSPRWRGCPEPEPGPAAEADCLVRNPAGSLTVAAVALALRELRVSAGAGGSADALAAGVSAVAAAGSSAALGVTGDDAAALRAVPEPGWLFAGWTLSGGNGSLACAEGPPSSNPCTLAAPFGSAAGSFTADASATASFNAVASALTVSAGPGGSVAVTVAGAAAATVAAGDSTEVGASAAAEVVLTAERDDGWRLLSWTLSGGEGMLECAATSEDPPNPCTLAAGPLAADASAAAVFEAIAYQLEAGAGAGGSVDVTLGGASVTVAAATTRGFGVDVLSAVALVAVPATGRRLAGWTLSGGNGMLACAAATDPDPDPNACALATGSFTADASASAAFEAVPRRLEVAAGAGGSVAVTVAGAAATVGAGMTDGFDVDVGSAAALEAVPDPGWRLLSWTLSGGNGMLECAAVRTCALAIGSFTADASATAAFEVVTHRLTAAAGAGGMVTVSVNRGVPATVGAAMTDGFDVDVRSQVALEAVPAAGHRFAGWTLSGGDGSLACAGLSCALAAGSLTADASASAAFTAVFALTVSAGAGGSVAVAVDGAAAGGAAAGESTSVAVTALSAVTLTAVPAAGQRLDSWTLSGGNGMLACAAQSCALAVGSLTADASASAAFEAAPNSLEAVAGANGSVSVAVDGAVAGTAAAGESTSVAVAAGSAVVLTADPDDGWRLSEWTLSGGNGSLECVEGRLSSNPCTLATGSLTADASATATFEAVFALTVSAGEGGSVAVAVDGAAAGTAAAGESTSVVVTALSAVVLTAVATAGHSFDSWTLSGGNAPLACAAVPTCTLAAGSFTDAASASAAFEVVTYRLEAVAGAGGSVNVMIDGVSAGRASAGTTEGFSVDVRSVVELAAVPDPGWRLLSWTLSGGNDMLACTGLSCPFALAAGSFTADASATATFEVLTYRLTAGAGAGGRVTVTVAAGGDSTEVSAAMTQGFDVDVRSAVELEAFPDDGQGLAAWALSGGNGMLSCAAVRTCTLAAGSFTADASASAEFAADFSLAVSAGAGGRVTVAVGGAPPVTVDAEGSTAVTVGVGSAVALTAIPAGSNVFAGWTGACAGAEARCELPTGAGGSAAATFGGAAMTLAVSAGAGGGVDVVIGQAATRTVGAGSESTYVVAAASAAALTARPGFGRLFERWTLSGGLACDSDSAVCELAAGSASGGAAAAFGTRQSTLTVSAGDDGSVTVSVGDLAVTVTAGNSTDVAVTVDDAVALAAMPAVPPARFVRWALSDGLACQDGPETSPCMLYPVGADGSADAEFSSSLPDSATWIGPGAVEGSGLALTAVPYADGAFEEWRGGGCDGSAEPECMRPDPDSGYPVAVFRPFVAAGIKSLAFGLGYQGESPHSFQVSLRRRTGAGYELPPALEGLPGSGQAFASLAVPVHLLPWGRRGYLTEACDASSTCEAARGGERALAQAVSRAVTGYFKAPGASAGELFGLNVALSADGATLAVGAPGNDSSVAGVFAPGDTGYQAAPSSGGAFDSGAVTVYSRTGAVWNVEAFVKAPVAGAFDDFGSSVALSGDGGTLAVGSPDEASASTGTFAPSDVPGSDYQLALASNVASSGAAYVYRRSTMTGTWAIEAFVKSPNTGNGDLFTSGQASGRYFGLALSDDGDVMAVGARFESSSYTGAFVHDESDSGYLDALDDNGSFRSGAAYVYRRSDAGRWALEAFLKAPVTLRSDFFGTSVSLSGDGATLAVGAIGNDSSHAGAFAPGDPGYQAALDSDGASVSGAAYVYRSTESGTWGIEAFLKAPKSDSSDNFGAALALSADGGTLAVGATGNDSSHAGAFAPGDAGYQAALDSGAAADTGAVTVYRRSSTGQWTVAAFVKAPNPGRHYRFGVSLDLSSNGVVMAVGSSGEDSSFSGVFVPDGDDYQDALDNVDLDTTNDRDDLSGGAGAAYVYRRSDDGRWALEAFVKPPNSQARDDFGTGVALSGDGDTLAAGAPYEDGAVLDRPVDGGHIPDSGGVDSSGAVYLY